MRISRLGISRGEGQLAAMCQSFQPSRIRLLIADDHEAVRKGLRFVLSRSPEFEVVGEADSVEATLLAIDTLAPDIVVLDFDMGEQNGGLVLDTLACRPQAPRVVMLSMEDERVVGAEMRRRGAAAYVPKHAPTVEILAELRKIRSEMETQGSGLPPPTSSPGRDVPPAGPRVSFTRRELEVMLCLKHGHASKTIARQLGISDATVDVHKHRLRKKLGLQSDLELARYASLFVREPPPRTEG